MTDENIPFCNIFAEPLRNGLTRPRAVRGHGVKMVNMGEIFSHSRIKDISMDRVLLSDVEAERYLLQSGDLLFARQSLVLEGAGKCSIFLDSSEPVTFEGHLIRVRINPQKGNPLYYYYYFQSPQGRSAISSIVEQVAAAGIRGSDLSKIEVPYPKPTDQCIIAHILGALDDKIELNRRMNKTLEYMARAIFKSWFVDFDPVRAKAEGRGPKLPKNIAALFPDSFQDSELGQIPMGWEVKPLSELTTLITKGTTPTQEDMTSATGSDAQINYVRVNTIDENGLILIEKLIKIPESVHVGVLKRSILQANDVLYTIAGTIGRIAITEEWVLPANTNQAIAIIRSKPTIPASFIILTMRHEIFREELHSNIVHAVQANLSLGMLAKARAIVPPAAMLIRVFQPVDNILSKISANYAQSRTLVALRNVLLPKLISGKIRMRGDRQLI